MNTSSAHQLFQDTPAAPFLTIVEKPVICPSALREPKGLWAGYGNNKGRVFEAMRYDNDLRIFQDLASGATYHLHVSMEQVESQVFTASFINGRIVSTEDYFVNRQFAGRSFRYIYNAEQAVQGAYEHLQSLVLSGKV